MFLLNNKRMCLLLDAFFVLFKTGNFTRYKPIATICVLKPTRYQLALYKFCLSYYICDKYNIGKKTKSNK